MDQDRADKKAVDVTVGSPPEEETPFDFKAFSQGATVEYLRSRDHFDALASVVRRIIEESLKRRGINVHSVQARAKTPESFARKVETPSEDDPNRPKYLKPLDQITDLSGVRIITYLPSTLKEVDELIREEFEVIERSDKGVALRDADRFGYQSIHYLVKLSKARSALPEYEPYEEAVTEIQVRTVLQHAWAEIEHDIQYKSSIVIPKEIRRRFMALAGLLEVADREFQSIQDADKELRASARAKVAHSQLSDVEITPDALKAYLDRRLGPDARIADWSYEWEARLLKKLGFTNLEQVDECIKGLNDDRVNRAIDRTRQGQTTRFEYMLLAGMGETFIQRHIFADQPWYGPVPTARLEALRDAGIAVGNYDPRHRSGDA